MNRNLPNILSYFSLLIFIILMSGNSYSQTITGDCLKITSKDRQNSDLFKSLKGGDRLLVFNNLQYLIKTVDAGSKSETSASERMGVKTTTLSQVKALLGEPDAKIQQTLIFYNLKAQNAACKAVIGISKDGEVTFCTIKDCN